MILGILIPIVFIVALVVVARKLFARDAAGAPSTFSIRRLFQYALLFGLLAISAAGVAGLIGRLFDIGQTITETRTTLARDITFSIIGVPLYALVGRWTRKTLVTDPSERHSIAWNSYLGLVSITALIASMTSAYSVLLWALGDESFQGRQLSTFLVWGLIWIAHWQIIQSSSKQDEARIHYVFGSLIGFATTSFGLGDLVASVARQLIDSDDKSLLLTRTNPTIQAISLIIVGLPVWYQYWLKVTINLKRELLWYSYVILAGVAGGFLTLVISGSIMIYDVLVWYFGEPTSDLVSQHFSSSASAFGGVVVGLAAWWYHGSVLNSLTNVKSETAIQPTEAKSEIKSRDELRRVYEYIVSGIGLIAAAAGLMMVIVAIIESLTPGEFVSTTSSTNTLLVALTLILVGSPVWYFFWSRIQVHVWSDEVVVQGKREIQYSDEQQSPTRRIFLLMLFGVAAIAAVISVLTGVFQLLDDALNSQLGTETLREARFAIAILISNAAISWYHWSIYRQEKDIAIRQPKKEKFILLVGPKDEAFANFLHKQYGWKVQMWRSEDKDLAAHFSKDGLPYWDKEKVVSLIQSSEGDELMVIREKKGVKLIPISRD